MIAESLKANISHTIGIAHEIIVIDNSGAYYSIFEAYNLGVSKSKFPYVCFMHDDITYYTTGWGNKVTGYFADAGTGAIGVAGSPYFPKTPGSWWAGGLINEVLIRKVGDEIKPEIKLLGTSNSGKTEVVVLDGVWLCIRKALFSTIAFDSVNFDGFHFYDIDISLQIHRLGYKIYCVSDILLQHFGLGNMNLQWAKNAVTLQKKWAAALPASCVSLSYREKCMIEYHTLNEYVNVLIANKVSKKSSYRFAVVQLLKFYYGYLNFKTFGYFLKYFFKSI